MPTHGMAKNQFLLMVEITHDILKKPEMLIKIMKYYFFRIIPKPWGTRLAKGVKNNNPRLWFEPLDQLKIFLDGLGKTRMHKDAFLLAFIGAGINTHLSMRSFQILEWLAPGRIHLHPGQMTDW
jgi:hypothetical protein